MSARMPGRTPSQIVCVAFLPVIPSVMQNVTATHTVGTIAKHPLAGQLIRHAPLSCAAARDPPPACPTRFPRHITPTMCRFPSAFRASFQDGHVIIDPDIPAKVADTV